MNNSQYKNFSDSEWFDLLVRSVNSRVVDGIEFPKFPFPEIQAQFVGSSYENALSEALKFYSVLKDYARKLGVPFQENTTTALDFGCGWGRFLRFFMKDISEKRLYGVDIDPSILDVCRDCGVRGQLSQISPKGTLPFPDKFFDVAMAYSVFTHLPEQIHLAWMREIARVSKPGCVFVLTLEPPRFLDFVDSIDSSKETSGWHLGLAKFQNRMVGYRNEIKQHGFVYLPTGGGDYRSSDVYGDAVVTKEYVDEKWSEYFNIIDYIDDASRFWQAVLIVQRK